MARILLADDAAIIRMSLAATLTGAGHTCAEAQDASEAIGLLEDSGFDLLVTDLFMPGDGLTVVRAAERLARGMPKILMTGGMSIPPEFAASVAWRFGADALLLKPFDNRQLLQTVSRFTGAARPAQGVADPL